MTKSAAIFLMFSLHAGSVGAAELLSRYGVITAVPSTPSETQFKIQFAGRNIATVAAQQVTFYRVTPLGAEEFVIVEKWKPGLYCHKSYLVLTLHQNKQSEVSSSFGDCYELSSLRHIRNGIQVVLRSTGPRRDSITFNWVRGELVKRRGHGIGPNNSFKPKPLRGSA